jgi:nucleotide-binding universal stress UspA family protein
MDQVKNFIKKEGVKCTAEMIKTVRGHETLAHAVIDYATKVEADLIMIMTQQEGEITPLFIGSTAQDIINTSETPVMSIVPVIKRDVEFAPY